MDAMTTQRATNGVSNGRNGHNGFHSDSEPDSISTEASGASIESVDSVNGITNGTSGLKINPRRRMRRKQSSPMMPAFMVSAPGKVIVFGEHAVVHGKVSAGGKDAMGNRHKLTCWVYRLQLLLQSRCGHISSSQPSLSRSGR